MTPWTVVRSDCKKRARISAMRFVLIQFNYTRKDADAVGVNDPTIISRAKDIYEPDELIRREILKK